MEPRKKKIGIVAIGYNRQKSLSRLLYFLQTANYHKEEVSLIISLDYCEDDAIREYAKGFQWGHGNKILCFNEERVGLREHVLQCGNYVNKYDLDAIAVFEDDIVPAWDFFTYTRQAVERFNLDEHVAGIALYSPRFNQNAWKGFEPARSQYDNFYMQYACSWGQVWTRRQWNDFYAWYIKNMDTSFNELCIPENVARWPASSWLKYYIKYCIEKNKYFVYPYTSLATNFHEEGTHARQTMNCFQVSLLEGEKSKYFWGDIDDAIKYDAFFERIGLGDKIGIEEKHLCTDLYGKQPEHRKCRYWLTTQKADYQICEQYGNSLRVTEENVLYNISGKEIYLYDTFKKRMNEWNDIEQIMKEAGVTSECKGLVLVGAGEFGRQCLKKLQEKNVNVLCFADKDSDKIGRDISGKKIVSYSEMKRMKDKIKIYITVANIEVREEIETMLWELGIGSQIIENPYNDCENKR